MDIRDVNVNARTRDAKPQIVQAKGNREVLSDVDPKFFLQYTGISVGAPCIEEDDYTVKSS